MPRKPGLGKGLDALIPREEESIPVSEAAQLPIDRIFPNPHQPRTAWNPEDLEQLAESIRIHGILQPLVVRQESGSNEYILIAGERRLRAAQMVGLKTVPVVLRQAGDEEQLELALIENIQRTDLNPIETAEAYRQLSNRFGLSTEEIARRVGKSRSKVANALRLFDLPKEIQDAVAEGKISEGHAVALLMLKNQEAQMAAYAMILMHELSVRETEELARKMSGDRPIRRPKSTVAPEVSALENRIREHLGTRVQLHHSSTGHGSLSIYYFSEEELNALVGKILNE